MSNVKKRIEELDLLDDFLFTEATIDPQTAPLLLKIIIERAVGLKVEKLIIEPQKTVNGVDTNSHGIRMDVMAREVTDAEGKTVRLFDVEPNNVEEVHLPKRSRYYQALTDVKLLEAGVDYDKLPDMWTIWILPYDPFGLDYRIYTVKNIVEEDPEIEYNDGIRKLFLYTKGKKGGTKALQDLLGYLQNTTGENAVDEDLKKLHTNVERLKSNKQIGVKYMHMQEVIKYAVKEEVEAAKKELEKEAKQKLEEAKQKMEEVMLRQAEAVMRQAEAAKQEAEAAKQEAEAVKQEADAAKQEADAAKQEAEAAQKLTQSTMKLMQLLLEAERYDDLRLVMQDERYRMQMLRELGID